VCSNEVINGPGGHIFISGYVGTLKKE